MSFTILLNENGMGPCRSKQYWRFALEALNSASAPKKLLNLNQNPYGGLLNWLLYETSLCKCRVQFFWDLVRLAKTAKIVEIISSTNEGESGDIRSRSGIQYSITRSGKIFVTSNSLISQAKK